jgi:hypothetical protein
VKEKQKLAHPEPDGAWTKPDAYMEALAFKRTFRRAREHRRRRTQPETPRLLLSTVPFLALLGLLAILAVGIMIAAFPGSQPQPKQKIAVTEQGVAQRGWFQEAEKEMHH